MRCAVAVCPLQGEQSEPFQQGTLIMAYNYGTATDPGLSYEDISLLSVASPVLHPPVVGLCVCLFQRDTNPPPPPPAPQQDSRDIT